MTTIAHVMPIALRPRNRSAEGVDRPGLEVSTFQTGYHSSRDWFEYNLSTYSWNLARMSSSSGKLAAFRAFLRHTRLGGDTCWIREALSKLNDEIVISPIGDGSRTSFVLPFHGSSTPADLVVLVNNSFTAAYTVHTKANILTDAQANAVGSTTGMEAVGSVTLSQASYPVADGLTSFLVTPLASAANLGLKTTVAARPAVAASQKYTFMAAVRGVGAVQLDGDLYNSGGSAVGSTATDTGTMIPGGWTILTAEHAGHADAVKAHIEVYRTATSDAAFHVACLGIIPGTLDKWFLPSEAPMVIEFDSAPGDRERVLAHGTGVRMALCRLQARSGAGWKLYSPGDADGAQFSADEELE